MHRLQLNAHCFLGRTEVSSQRLSSQSTTLFSDAAYRWRAVQIIRVMLPTRSQVCGYTRPGTPTTRGPFLLEVPYFVPTAYDLIMHDTFHSF